MLQYGFLQGTFGLPYGGYCVKPQNISSIILNPDSANTSMFCVIGKYSTVMNWLGRSSSMVANRCTAQDTFTHDLAVEVYMRESPLMRFVRGKNNINVQLVVRIARTWDGGCGVPGVSDQFKPFLKSIVPSGITLAEIAGELKRASPGLVTAATSNKTLLNVVLARVSSQSPVEVDHGQNNYGLHSFPHTRDNGLSVCEYDSELPPLYSE